MKKRIILLLTIILSMGLNSQVDKSTINVDLSKLAEENTVITTNTNIILVGEYLYYKLLILSEGKPSQISKVAYVELIGPDKESVLKHTLAINNSSANSRLFIPSQLNSGHYKLLAYTNLNKNNVKKSIAILDLYIINGFTSKNQPNTTKLESVNLEKSNVIKKVESINEKILIKPSKTIYKNREAVSIDVLTNSEYQNGDYLLSIRKLDSLNIINANSVNKIALSQSNKFYIPEIRGQLIIGQLSNIKSVTNIKDKKIALSISGKDYVFKISNSNKSGLFYFSLDNNFKKNEIILQVIEEDKESYKIELLDNTLKNLENLSFKQLQIDKTLKYYIEQRNIKNQIENAYYESKQDSIIAKTKPKAFYKPKEEKKYILDDYTRFPTVRETFIEVLLEAAVRKKGDSYRILVYDDYDEKKNKTIKDIDPLILVDGLVVQNNNDLMNYDPKKIESISIVKGQYLYGPKLYQGIIDVSTFNQDFKTTVSGNFFLETKIEVAENATNYYQPDYSDNTKNKRVPDYRRQLVWLPKVDLENKINTFKTYTSDDKGVYEIKLEGYSKNGEFVSTTNYFEVN